MQTYFFFTVKMGYGGFAHCKGMAIFSPLFHKYNISAKKPLSFYPGGRSIYVTLALLFSHNTDQTIGDIARHP